MVLTVRRCAPATSYPTPLNVTPHELHRYSEISLPQELVKYAMVDAFEGVVGTSITSDDMEKARIMMLTVRRAPPPRPPPPNPHRTTLNDPPHDLRSDSKLSLPPEACQVRGV